MYLFIYLFIVMDNNTFETDNAHQDIEIKLTKVVNNLSKIGNKQHNTDSA
jgi:hypothetical protein